MKPFAAVTRNSYGKGKGWYVGTVVKEEAFYDNIVARLLEDANVKSLVTPPAGVEASVREGQGKQLLFLINHTERPQTVSVPEGKLELLSGKRTQRHIQLDMFDVAVIKL